MNEATVSLKISAEDIAHMVAQAAEGMIKGFMQLPEDQPKNGLLFEVPNELYWKDPEAGSSVVSLKRKKAQNNVCFICFGEYQQARCHPVMLEAIAKAKEVECQLDIDAQWVMFDQCIERDEARYAESGDAFLLEEMDGWIAQNVSIKLTPLHFLEDEKNLPPFLQKLDDVLA